MTSASLRPAKKVGASGVVLFVCVQNSARSLIAEAIFNHEAPPGWRAESAGTQPAAQPNPRTGPVLEEIGYRLPPHPPQLLTPSLVERADLIITMGCLDDASCPRFLRREKTIDWGLPDPAPLTDAGFREVRDEIRRRVVRLVGELSGERPGTDDGPRR